MNRSLFALATTPAMLMATAFDCRQFDCVTPLLRAVPPIPAGLSIPQPAVTPPGPSLPAFTFTPVLINALGHVFGRTNDTRYTFFLSDLVRTTLWEIPAFEPIVHSLSDNGDVVFEDGAQTLFLHTPDLSQPVGFLNRRVAMAPGSRVDSTGAFEYNFLQFLGVNAQANAFLIRGNKLSFQGVVLERDVPVLVTNAFTPAAIPEPALLIPTAVALLWIALRTRTPK